MNKFTSRLKGQSHFLSAKDCIAAFGYFDKDDTGVMEFDEMQTAFNTMMAPAEVDISCFSGEQFSPERFRRMVEMVHKQYPQYDVASNLLKFIRENREKQDDDDADISDKVLDKFFAFFDKDGSGSCNLNELLNVWSKLGLPIRMLINEQSQDGSVSSDEFKTMIRNISDTNPDYNVDDKINAFVGDLGPGAPDIPSVDPSGDDPNDAPDDEEAPGTKKALICGLNYRGSSCELGGCINDAEHHKAAIIEHFGFPEENITIMTDDCDDDLKPTAQNMRDQLQKLIEGASAGDMLFFSYSGHGSQLPDSSGSEPDGKNEILCPLDLQDDWYANCIKDDWLYDFWYNQVPEGVRCICFYDCCHSATMADLSCTRDLVPPGEEMQDRFLEPPDDMKEAIDSAKNAAAEAGTNKRNLEAGDAAKNLIWTISGCQDNQTSADATINGIRQGACSWAYLAALEEEGRNGPWHKKYENLLTHMRKKLKTSGYSQIPGMATTDEVLFQRFVLANKPE